MGGLHGGFKIQSMVSRWERRMANPLGAAPATELPQSSSLFSLPTELRLQIYSLILPYLDAVTEIVRETGGLVFVRGNVVQAEHVVASFSGIVKKMHPR